jgi:hypothetical protein
MREYRDIQLDLARAIVAAAGLARFGAIAVPEPHAKHHTQSHQDAKRLVQKRRFCGKFTS